MDDNIKVTIIDSHLSRAAKAKLNDFHRVHGPFLTYDAIMTHLSLTFPEGQDADIHQTMILDNRQCCGESVVEFVDALKKLRLKAYPTLSKIDRANLVKPIFLRNILPAVKDGIKFHDF